MNISIVKHHHCFLCFVWQHKPYQWKVLSFRLTTATTVFTSLVKPVMFLCQFKVCWQKGMNPSVLYWFILDFILVSLSLNSMLLSIFLFKTMLGYSGHVIISTIWQTFWHTAFGSSFGTETTHNSPSGYVLLGQDHLLCWWVYTICWLCHVIQSDMLNVNPSLAHLSISC